MAKFDVDYPHVRENADILAVLAHYEVEVIGDGDQLKGQCPFHASTKLSLNVNTSKNVFKCHGCGCGGNVIKLVQMLDPKLENPRRAALEIARLSGISAKPDGSPVPIEKPEPKAPVVRAAEVVAEPDASSEGDGRLFNRPLTFELQLEPVAPNSKSVGDIFAQSHGLDYARLAELGIGMASRGSMKDRLAIPIRNADGEIVAYCGCDVGLFEDESEPLYKLPQKFQPELELFGWDVAQYFERIVVVDRFLPVVKYGGEASKYGEAGFGVASLMGTELSDRQLELLIVTQPEVIICFEDDADLRSAAQVAARIAEAGLWARVERAAAADVTKIDNDDFCHLFGKV